MRRPAVAALLGLGAVADFVYVDFNETQGLVLNGAASTSACAEVATRSYGPDETNYADGKLPTVYGEDAETSFEATVETHAYDAASATNSIVKRREQGSRDDYRRGDADCAGRVRLTPSRPHSAGAAWYHLPRPVAGGFEAAFSFKISDHSRACTKHRDLDFSLNLYENCHIHGGDGLAFVIHADANGTRALGSGGGEMGYGGIKSSIAVELDTSYNPESDPAPVDHVAVRARGPGRANSAVEEDALLAPGVVHDLADGKEHFAKVAYLPYVAMDYFANFSTTPNAAPFVVDAGEHRRCGTFLVWLDEGIGRDSPSIAFPINLSELLGLDGEGLAFVGFTAATGRRWEKHDVTSWYMCDREDCLMHPSPEKQLFDYHTESRKAGAYQPFRFSPGGGYGGVSQPVDDPLPFAPTRHTREERRPRDLCERDAGAERKSTGPGREATGPDVEHLAAGRLNGLAAGAEAQRPPNTEF
ncbi:concanavalin A-like lectin/glucanase domain-containing protein [Pelagophyceae sp. CCMP2097]|nr:concanavalin A-like lectin/glucanase domain-containing protein [Pelagophyceae sp. CCMP2097]